jgi:transcriptional regulator
VYVPKHFAFPDGATAALHDWIEGYPFGILIAPGDGTTDHERGLQAVHLPFVLDRTQGPNGTLAGHMARANPAWTTFAPDREVLVIFQGPHRYVSPDWYANPGLVPTWNYIAVHCYGAPQIIAEDQAVAAHLERLSAVMESHLAPKPPWSVGQVKDATLAALRRQIVAFELPIARLEGKRKLNQNRSPADRAGVIRALEASGGADDLEMAEAMRGL